MKEDKLEARALAYVIGYVSSVKENPTRDKKVVKFANELLNEIYSELKVKREVR